MQTPLNARTARRFLPALLCPLFVALALGLAPRSSAEPQTAVATPDAAVGIAVTGLGRSYAGGCAATRSPDDAGKTCSQFVAQSGSVRAYLAGRTFSEFSVWVFVEEATDGWRALGTQPLDQMAPSLVVPWPAG